ncbi:Uncharacterized protein FWK35_00015862 [Aphis craccivora]|uniref:Uncharacterized protein n=1 Tax=Aphis craccivora TaxID=307492 RepID=A0A6G0Y1Y4_APHCR|nr:Uncharacterized protein FWK35_00015862 [Aphis craccivora]
MERRHICAFRQRTRISSAITSRANKRKKSASEKNKIINLEKLNLIKNHRNQKTNSGTHWVYYKKTGKSVLYFDSFGNLRPPLELEKYFKGCDIEYNYERKRHTLLLTAGIYIYTVTAADMTSQTVSLSGNSSELECHFFPPLELPDKSVIGLLSIQTYNYIPNVEAECDTLHIIHGGLQGATKIKISTGCYEIITLETKIRGLLKAIGVNFFSLSTDNSTLKCTVHYNSDIDLNVEDSIAPLLGFDKRVLTRGRRHESDRVVKIMDVNTIKVEFNLALGSFDNGRQSHTIHEFYPVVPPGYKIVKIPNYCVLQIRLISYKYR